MFKHAVHICYNLYNYDTKNKLHLDFKKKVLPEH